MPTSTLRPRRSSFTRAASALVIAASLSRAAPSFAVEPAPQPASQRSPRAADAPPFAPSAGMDLAALERVVVARAPELERAALDVDLAAADVRQARLLANPSLDATWGTIPIGATNPPDLSSPMLNVPNYGVGLSYTFEIGKRGPRLERALAMERAAKELQRASARERALELARLLGVLATSALRLAGAHGVVDSGKKAIALAEDRLASSFGTPLDIDRLRIEVSRTEQQLLSAESDRAEALAACAALVGAPCKPFASDDEAKGFLAGFIASAASAAGPVEERPDLRALEAESRAATAELSLAKAQSIPDPTVRVGYLHDRFIASGAQQNSLSLSVSLPIPIFDHGQALAAAAEARRDHTRAQELRAIEASKARLPALAERLAAQRARQEALTGSVMPRALAVLRDVEAAAANRLLSLADVIQARRAVAELLVEEADSFADAFDAALEIAAERPSSQAARSTPETSPKTDPQPTVKEPSK